MSFGSQHHLSHFYDNFKNCTRDLFVMPSEISEISEVECSNILVEWNSIKMAVKGRN